MSSNLSAANEMQGIFIRRTEEQNEIDQSASSVVKSAEAAGLAGYWEKKQGWTSGCDALELASKSSLDEIMNPAPLFEAKALS